MGNSKEIHARIPIAAYQYIMRVADEHGVSIAAAVKIIILRDRSAQSGTKVGRTSCQEESIN